MVDVVAAWVAIATLFGLSNVIERIGSPLPRCGLDFALEINDVVEDSFDLVVIALPRKPTGVDRVSQGTRPLEACGLGPR